MPEEKSLAVHRGHAIFLDVETGTFWTTLDGRRSESGKLATLKTRLDDFDRRRSRAKVSNLELDALVSDRWNERPSKWIRGIYQGLNAHTLDVQLVVDGVVRQLGGATRFLRSDNRAGRQAIVAALGAVTQARKALKRAEDELEAEFARHSHRLEVDSRWSSREAKSKAERAAEAEERFVTALAKAVAP